MESGSGSKYNITPFIKATVDTFETMVNVKIVSEETKPSDETQDVSGMIDMTGSAEGTLSMGLPNGMAFSVANSFLGEENVSEPLMVDTIAELVNIIAGFAKKDMPDTDLRLSLPSVVVGEGHTIRTRVGRKKTVATFVCPLGRFQITVCLEDTTNAESAATIQGGN